MKKQCAIVTGGSRGIGFAIAEKLYQNDFEVIIVAKNQSKLDIALAKLPKATAYACDFADKTAVKALAEKLLAKHGAPDLLVNNAGFYSPGEVHSEDDEVFESMMAVNLAGTYYFTKGLIGSMKARKSGMVVNMCSTASTMAYPNGGSYSISKHALLGFSKSLRAEMMEHGVRVTAILPGPTWTSSWEGAGIPPERMIPAEDIAEAVWTAYQMNPRTVMEEMVLRPQLGDL